MKNKTNRGNNKDLEKATDEVKNLGKSIRSAAKDYSVCHVSLYRYCKKENELELKLEGVKGKAVSWLSQWAASFQRIPGKGTNQLSPPGIKCLLWLVSEGGTILAIFCIKLDL